MSLPETDLLRRRLSEALPGVPVAFATAGTPGPWPSVEALLVGSPQREFPQVAPGLLPNLRFVQRVYTGLDAFPFDRIAPGVRVAGNVGGFAPYVAEQALTLLLALANDLVPNYASVRSGRLRPVEPPRWLPGQVGLLLGFGEIARELARRLAALGVRVEGLSREGAPDPGAERMYAANQLLEALSIADLIVDCRPLTARTRATIDRAALERMKANAIFVNVGRAGTVDEEALYHHLAAHPGFRFGTDVLWREDPVRGTVESRWPFTDLPNFLASPHVAGLGTEPRARALGL
ncbi:MAG TPA: NAD(P)-dependent oxidoreductase, partial [Thermoplasmata archaeon]|nr:NAD(P)-dependent oxidoreductase [Thermoplasmata archaeon]